MAQLHPVSAIRKLSDDLHAHNRQLFLIFRKLHYTYFYETHPEIRFLLLEIPSLFSTYIAPSRFFSSNGRYGSPFYTQVYPLHLSPNILPENRNAFLENNIGNIKLSDDDKRLLSLAKNNRAILLYCAKTIHENHTYHNHSWDFDMLVRKTYDLSRGYFSNAWDCFETSEKAIMVNLSVEWAKKKSKSLLTTKVTTQPASFDYAPRTLSGVKRSRRGAALRSGC